MKRIAIRKYITYFQKAKTFGMQRGQQKSFKNKDFQGGGLITPFWDGYMQQQGYLTQMINSPLYQQKQRLRIVVAASNISEMYQ